MDPMVFQFIGQSVENATNAFVTPAAANLIGGLQILAITGVTLYIVLTGYAIVTGAVQAPVWTFLKQCVKIIFIAAFALTVDGYAQYVMGTLRGLESGLASLMNTTGGPAGTNIYQVLDASLGRGFKIVGKCLQEADQAGWDFGSAMAWFIAGMVVGLGTLLISCLGAAVVIVAKFSLGIVFALGPIFILALMFPVTAKFFDSWLSQALNYILTIVIIGIIMTFATAAYDRFIAGADFSGSGESNPMFAALQIGGLTGVLVWIILQAGGIASGLAGGVSMAAMGIRHLASPVTGSLKVARGAGNIANPMSTRRDMQSGMMTTARRANHMVAGNTMWNPAYRQHVISNMGKNWGRARGGSVNKDS